jgi:hypothetical protein
VHVPHSQQVGDTMRQDPGLAGPGTGHDQQRTAGVHHRSPLLRVETGEQSMFGGLRPVSLGLHGGGG